MRVQIRTITSPMLIKIPTFKLKLEKKVDIILNILLIIVCCAREYLHGIFIFFFSFNTLINR